MSDAPRGPVSASLAATTASSSTPGAIAIGSIPAARRVCSRAGDVEARYRRMSPSCRSPPVLWNARGMAETRRPRRPSTRGRGARRPAPQAPDLDGPVVELDVERVAHGGVFVAHHEGRVVFVSDAIPGERVSARITDRTHDRFWRAETLEVLQASPDRQAHVWAEASVERAPGERAGGAEFGHIRIGRQRELKGDVLREALARMGGVEVDVEVREVDASLAPGVTSDGTGWRTRLRLQVGEDGVVGPYAARSHTVVPVASVPLAVPALADLAPLDARFPGARAIDLVAPSWATRRSWWSRASGCRRARARRSRNAWATARSGSTATGSGRCTAVRRPP